LPPTALPNGRIHPFEKRITPISGSWAKPLRAFLRFRPV
jgi:hypothetical protein